MLKTIMVLNDGTEISSGNGKTATITNCKITECVNSGEELTPGSVCCACAEITILCADGSLNIAVGDEIAIYKISDSGVRYRVGIFIAEKPRKTSAHVFKVTAYDRVSLLDMDLTGKMAEHISDFYELWEAGGYYLLKNFVSMICSVCGVAINLDSIPNPSFEVYPFEMEDGVTGRQIMQWVGETSGFFCRAKSDGELEFAQYANSNITLRPTGSRYYFGDSLSYEDYNAAPIDGLRFFSGTTYLEISSAGQISAGKSENPYILSRDNRIWESRTKIGNTVSHRMALLNNLSSIGAYRPCKVSIPACVDIHAGDIVTVVAPGGKSLRVVVMTKTQNGSRDTLECTGSPRLMGSTALNNRR